MTERLYYHDCYLREFDASVVAAEGNRLYLDRTAFYPTSGGQPFDRGTIGGVEVIDVIDEDTRIAHVVAGSVPVQTPVRAAIDWQRRYDYMQQHSGQHLLAAVFTGLYGIDTLSVHFADDYSTMDVAAPSLSAEQLRRIQERAAELVFENRPIQIGFTASAGGLRKEVDREGSLRVVEITGLDRSACGGTHVRSTAEIGPIFIRKTEKIRNSTRLEFLAGMRAVRRALDDYDSLAAIARAFSASVEEAAPLVKTTLDRANGLEKARKKMAAELARYQGLELYNATSPDAAGIRRHTVRGPIDDDVRALAQAFTAQPKSVFTAVSPNPPSLLVAASKDSGINAGERLKGILAGLGGRGGGSPVMAQGSLPDAEALEKAVAGLDS